MNEPPNFLCAHLPILREELVNDKSSLQNLGQFCTILEDTDVLEISSYPAIYFLGGAVSVATDTDMPSKHKRQLWFVMD